ncbi:glycosyltransferase [Chloroflexota bacterium]
MLDDRLKRNNDEGPAGQDKCAADPTLAAIIVVPDKYDTARRTISHLRVQTVADQMEIVIVAPSQPQLGLVEADLACFHSWQVVQVGKVTSIARGFVAGIRNANASIIVLTEDHSFPDAKWAELLIAAHQQHWAVVGPSMRNCNPDTTLSWADFYQAYGEWAYPVSSGVVRHLPGHNSSYKRDVLLEYGDRLEYIMQAESVLHRHLTAQGYEFMLESATCTSHLNFASWSSWIPARYYTGRQFAATWSLTWSGLHRLVFAVASPLIPWIRLWRIQKQIRRRQSYGFFIRVIPVIFAGLVLEAVGQMMGYAGGAGNSIEKVAEYEFNRIKKSEPQAHEASK